MIFQAILLYSAFVFASALPTVDLDPTTLRPDLVPFVPHSGKQPMDNWLAVNLPFKPVEQLRMKIEAKQGIRLNHRSEAHITVLTPPEWQALQPHLSMQELQAAYGKKLQKIQFRPLCLGQFGKSVDAKPSETYFLVVQSEQLLEIREQILGQFIAKGGDRSRFDPLEYFPHITVGFTTRDLHAGDGALKDVRACTSNLRFRPRRSKVAQ